MIIVARRHGRQVALRALPVCKMDRTNWDEGRADLSQPCGRVQRQHERTARCDERDEGGMIRLIHACRLRRYDYS
jgi:hypothetical protein